MRIPISTFILSAVLYVFPHPAWTQSAGVLPDLVTDRPDRTESSRVVPKGFLQTEMGWNYSRSGTGAGSAQTHEFPDTLLRVGLLNRAEGRIGWGGGVWQPGNGETRSFEIADLEVGTKVFVCSQNGWIPETSVIAGVVLPSGSARISIGRIDPNLRLALSNGLSENISVGYNLGAAWHTGNASAGDRDTLAFAEYSISLGMSLGARTGIFFEFFGATPFQAAGGPANSLNCGLTLAAMGNLQFDVSGGIGISRASPEWFAGAGIAWRLPR